MTIETYSYIVPSVYRDSPTFAASELGKIAAAKGKDGIIKVTVGDIYDKPVRELQEWLHELRAEGLGLNPHAALSYIDSKGSPGLRAAAARVFSQDTNIKNVQADNIAVGNGGKGALNGAVSYLQAGDKVIVASTGWPTNYDMFPEGVNIIEVNSHGRGLLTPQEIQEALTLYPDAKAVLINSPCNPTGEKYLAQEREEVMELFHRHCSTSLANTTTKTAPTFQVILDDPYGRLIYDNTSMLRGKNECDLFERGFITTVRSMSKEYGMAGTRIGFAISKNPFIIQQIGKFNETHGGLSGHSQNEAQAALLFGEEFIHKTVQNLLPKRDALTKGIANCKALAMKRPHATIYGWINGKKLKGKVIPAEYDLDGNGFEIKTPQDMMKYIVEVAGVNPIPGTPFYAPDSPFAQDDWNFRFCFSAPIQDIENACKQLQAAEQVLTNPKDRINFASNKILKK